MLLKETLLLTCAVVTCNVMTTCSTMESNLNHTSHPTPVSWTPSDLTSSSTTVRRSGHQDVATRQTGGDITYMSLNSTVGQSQHVDIWQHGLLLRNESATSNVGHVQHIGVSQHDLSITNDSSNSLIERSIKHLSSRDAERNYTPEMNSPQNSAAWVDMDEVSEDNDVTRQCVNAGKCAEKTGSNFSSSTITSLLEPMNRNSSSRSHSETNVDTDLIPDSAASSQTTTPHADSRQTGDYRHVWDYEIATEHPETMPSESFVSKSESYNDLILEVGGQVLAVCELDMLCRDRCFRGTDETSADRATTAPNVMRSDTTKSSQGTTYTYHGSVSSEALLASSITRYRRLAGIDAHRTPSHKLRASLDIDHTPWKSPERIKRPRHKRALGSSTETPWHCSHVANQTCFCDVVCVLFGDCCPDVFTSCFHLKTSGEILTFISNVWRNHSGSMPVEYSLEMPQSAMDFVVKFSSCQKISITTGMLLVSKCPEDIKNTSMKDNCENSSQSHFPPVTGKFHHGDVSFRNIFCARCHGVKDVEVQVWRTQYDCDKNVTDRNAQSLTMSDLAEFVMEGMCNMSFVPPVDKCQPRQCQTYSTLTDQHMAVIKKNVQEGICSQTDAIFCQSYYYPKSGFTNAHCKICLQGRSRLRRDSQDMVVCDVGLYNYRLTSKQLSASVSGGILIILDVTGISSGGGTSTNICRHQEVFDPVLLECRSLTCPAGFRPDNGKCSEVAGQYFRDGDLQMFPGGWKHLVLTIEAQNVTGIPCEIPSAIVASSNVSVRELHINMLQSFDLSSADVQFYFLSPDCEALIKDRDKLGGVLKSVFRSVSKTTYQIPTLPAEQGNVGLINDTYHIHVSNTNTSKVAPYRCSGNNILHQVWDFSIEENNGTAYVILNMSRREIYYPLGSVGFQVVLTQDSARSAAWVLNQSVYVCDTWLSLGDNCSVVTYKLNDTVHNGSRLMVLSSGLYYDDGDFLISGDTVLVCTNFSSLYAPHQSLAYVVLNWLLNIVSIISLLLMLVLYGLFPELCTLPGKMTASLAASMMLTFLFNLFTLTELHHDYICPIAAVANHVVTLAQFGWMSAIAVNMALTFGPLTNKLVRTVNDTALFLRYNLAVWGSAVVIVMTSVVLDYTHPEPEDTSETATQPALPSRYPVYGYPYCTWFSGPMWTKLAFVMVPYLITFIISLVGFILTLIGIQQTSRSIQKLGKKSSDKTLCIIYLKLSSAMGFSWAISAVSNLYPNTTVLSYINMCLVLLQGMLLFLSFMVNNRVYLLLLKRFCARGNDSPGSAPTGSSIVTTLSA